MSIKEILLIAGLAIVTIFGVQQCRNKNSLKSEYAKALSVNDSNTFKMKTFVDENGKLNARVQTLEVDKQVYIVTHKKEIDSMAHALKVKPNNITSITTIGTTNSGSVTTGLDTNSRVVPRVTEHGIVYDTIKFYTFKYDKDKWLYFDGQIDTGKITVNYTFKDSLTLVGIRKKTGFLGLGPTKTFANVKSENPNTTYNSLKSIELTKLRPQRWSAGPYVGYGYNGVNWAPSIGVSLQWAIIKF